MAMLELAGILIGLYAMIYIPGILSNLGEYLEKRTKGLSDEAKSPAVGRKRVRTVVTQVAPSGLTWPGAVVCVGLGVGAPAVVFLFTFLAALCSPGGIAREVWMAPVVVSLAGIVGAGSLAKQMILPRRAFVDAASKPELDPDAYDVVSRRG
jgi:hypothetical protein